MYVSNLMLELMYFTFLVGGVFAVICYILYCTVRALAAAIGYEIIQVSNWLKNWANK